jgi:hypothetical protein
MGLGVTCNLEMTGSIWVGGQRFCGNTMSFSKTYLSIQEFWFLYMATESIPCRHQGTVLYKHIPLLDSSPLTNLNTFANGKISYGTAAKREVGIQSAHSKQHVELATGVASLEGARLFHLLCALFWECWPFSTSVRPLHPAWKIIAISELIAHSGLQIISLRAQEEPVVRVGMKNQIRHCENLPVPSRL